MCVRLLNGRSDSAEEGRRGEGKKADLVDRGILLCFFRIGFLSTHITIASDNWVDSHKLAHSHTLPLSLNLRLADRDGDGLERAAERDNDDRGGGEVMRSGSEKGRTHTVSTKERKKKKSPIKRPDSGRFGLIWVVPERTGTRD